MCITLAKAVVFDENKSMTNSVKSIISWNVNGIRAVEKKGFVDWLCACNADVVCLQETKAHPGQLSPALTAPGADENGSNAIYKSFWASAKKPGYSGTAIYSKTEPDKVTQSGIPEFDDEGRILIAYFGSLAVISAYFPNSQDKGARLGYKLDFNRAIKEICDKIVAEGKNVVLCGDYNVAHQPIDLEHPESNQQNPGYLPEEREWMTSFLQGGYTDTFRHFCAEPKQYTWWSYRMKARERNVGWRIDYHCVNSSFIEQIESSSILADVTGSDHCPILLKLK